MVTVIVLKCGNCSLGLWNLGCQVTVVTTLDKLASKTSHTGKLCFPLRDPASKNNVEEQSRTIPGLCVCEHTSAFTHLHKQTHEKEEKAPNLHVSVY